MSDTLHEETGYVVERGKNMCAYCEELKPLFVGESITKNEIRMKHIFITGRKIAKIENIMTSDCFKTEDEISDFELDYCPKCGKGLSKYTTDVQSLRESDRR